MTEQITLDETGITTALNQLSEFFSQIDVLELQKQELKESVMPDELREAMNEYRLELAAIDAEFSGKAETANKRIKELKKMIKPHAIEHGSTVKGDYLMAVWSKGKIKYNTEKLDDLALVFPEIDACRTVGPPTISFRKR